MGQIGGAVIYVAGKLRALPSHLMGKGKTENWANLIVLMLERLSIASGAAKGKL